MEPTQTQPPKRRAFPIGRVLVVVAVLAIVIIWIWAFAAGQSDPPGLLDDSSFGARATAICEAAGEEAAALPPAFEAPTPADRASTVAQSNAVYLGMLDDLEAAAPSGGEDQEMVLEWIGDWRAYVDDRADYAERLRSDQAARFYVSTKDGNQVTNPIDRFARINGMLPCATPSDLS